MADPVAPVDPAAPPAAAAPEAAPPAAAPAAAPVVAEAAPAPAPAPVVEPAAAPVVAEPAKMPTEAPTLLEKFDQEQAAKGTEPPAAEAKPAETKPGDKPVEAKPAEGEAKPGEAKPAEPAPAPAPEPTPITYEFKLPENVTLPDVQRTELDGMLTAFARNPNSVETQQALVDFHVARLEEAHVAMERQQHQVFADVRDRWVKEVHNDPELGGGNFKPAMQAIAYVRDNFLSSHPRGSAGYEADRAALDQFLHYTGAGDNPSFLRLMHNISVALNEPGMTATTEIKPIPQQEAGGRAPIYRHPTSLRNGR